MNEILNPYIAGAPVVETSMFFGRQDIFNWIERSLAGKYVDHILVLHGQRRVGKTSVLKQIPNFLPDKYIQVFFDLQGRTNTTLERFLWWLAREIIRALQQQCDIRLQPPVRSSFEADPDYLILEFLPGLRPLLGDQVLLLTFDEFDTLDNPEIQETFAKPLINYLRRLMELEGLSFIFSIGSSGNKLENMQASYTAFFKSALYRKISFLSKDDCYHLITEPVKGVLVYDSKAVEMIYEITSGHPYFTQLVCHELFSQCQKSGAWTISPSNVEAILDDVIERGTVNLKFVWDEATDLEKWILASLAQLEIGATTRQLYTNLQDQKIRFSEPDIYSAIIRLRDKDVLNRDNLFVVHLLLLWLQRNRPLDRVKEELVEVNPIVNRYIEIANTFRDQGQVEKALENYRNALEEDPNCINALVNIGNLLLKKDDFEDAADAYETAFHADDENISAKTGLCSTYLAWGDRLLEAANREDAVQLYQKILGINPEHLEARKRLASIFRSQAEDNLASGRDEAALVAFQMALKHAPDDVELSNRVQSVMAEKRDLVLDSIATRAENAREKDDWEVAINAVQNALQISEADEYLQVKLAQFKDGRRKYLLTTLPRQARQLADEEAWDRASSVWKEYLRLDPLNPEEAQAALDKTRKMSIIQAKYSQALDQMEAKDYTQTIDLLQEIIHVDPGYKDTSDLLAAAVKASRKTKPNWRRITWIAVPVLFAVAIITAYLVFKDRSELALIPAGLDFNNLAEILPINQATPTRAYELVLSPMPTQETEVAPSEEPSTYQLAKDFAEPILESVAAIQSTFEEDFTSEQDYWAEKSVYIHPVGYGEQGTDVPLSSFIREDALQIQDEPTEELFYDLSGLSEFLTADNFVLQFDFIPYDFRYESHFFLGFREAENQAYFLDIWERSQKVGDWNWLENWNWLSGINDESGKYELASGSTNLNIGQANQIQLIVNGSQIAVYKDGQPLTYIEDDTFMGDRIWMWFSSYKPIHVAIDNIRFWNLDEGEVDVQVGSPSEEVALDIETIRSYLEAHPPTSEDEFYITDFVGTDGLFPLLERGASLIADSDWGWAGEQPAAGDFALQFEYSVEGTGEEIFIDVDFRWGGNWTLMAYYLDIDPAQGTWKMVKYGFPSQVLGSGDIPGTSGSGQAGKVQLVVVGDQFGVTLNNELVGVFRDDRWTWDLNRILVGTIDQSVQIRLENVKFWNLDDIELATDSQTIGTTPNQSVPATTPSSQTEFPVPTGLEFTLEIFETPITSLSWSDESNLIAVTGQENTVSIINPRTGSLQRRFQVSADQAVSSDWQGEGGGDHLVAGGKDGRINIYRNGEKTRETWSLEDLVGKGEITILKWDQFDHNNIAAGTENGYLATWYAVSSSWSVLNFQLQADSGPIYDLDWSQNQPKLLTVSENEGLQVWNPTTGGRLMKLDYQSRSAAWSPDGRYIALEDHGLSLQPVGVPMLVVVQSGAVKAQTELAAEVNQVAWSPDGKLIATAGQDGVLRLWSGVNDNGIINSIDQVHEFHQDAEITVIIWLPDSDQIVTGDVNGRIWFWNLADVDF